MMQHACVRRRQWLALGVGGAALLGLAGTAVSWWRPARREGRFTPEAQPMLAAVARAVLAGLLPPGPAPLQAHLGRLEATVAGLPPHLQAELDRLFTLLLTPPGRIGLAGLAAPWERATPEAVHEALQALRLASGSTRQQVFHALRDLNNAAWFAGPEAWAAIGYPGPREL